MSEHVRFLGDTVRARGAADSLGTGTNFLFTLVMSYTVTCEIPGISAAGASPQTMRLTPAADAEYIRYGHCKSIDGVPMTPDGLVTPALLTRAALEASRIPSMTINAGGVSHPKLPYVETGLSHGEDISERAAMSAGSVSLAMEQGRDAGRHASDASNCVIIGESIPGGTTTALGVMRGLHVDSHVSSSMKTNPVKLKEQAVAAALARILGDDAKDVLRETGDPMLAFVSSMAAAASQKMHVILAGGTQMLAAFMLARRMYEPNEDNMTVVTTSYVADDESANLADVAASEHIPVICVDPGLADSTVDGIRAFACGHAKEGAGAGGAIFASIVHGMRADGFCALAEAEYARALAHGH